MMEHIYFVYDCESEKVVSEEIKPLVCAASLEFTTVEKLLKRKDITPDTKVIVFAELEEIKKVIAHSFVYGFSVALVAKKSQKSLRDTFEIPASYEEALKSALTAESKEIDLLYCGDEIVLWSALVGEAPPHGSMSERQLQGNKPSRIWALLKSFGKIFQLKKSAVTLKTYKEQEIETAVSGIVVIEHDNHTCASNLVRNFLQMSNGKMVALLVSPASVVDYFAYLYKAIFGIGKNLPKATGVILSEKLQISAQPPMDVKVDGEKYLQTPVTFEVHPKAFRLCASEKFWEKEAIRQGDDKEVVKLGNLPKSESEMEYVQKHIPFFTHADTQSYQELFASLREEARASSTFITLMVLSTVLATVGLFLNSSSVVIGAMLLAPLMQPIVAYAMGLLRFDMDLFWHGLRSVAIGILLVLVTSMSLAYLLPFKTVTPEIAGRLHPTLLDLIVAIVSGIAAAYAKNNAKIVGSLAGVSIAVALVPPISTSGIGLGWGEWSVFQNAFLLFLTNFAGIVFAAATTFMVLGFSPVKRAKNGLFLSSLIVLLISVPLYFSFSLMVEDAKIKESLERGAFLLDARKVDIENVLISHKHGDDTVIVRFDLVSDFHVSDAEKRALKAQIEKVIAPYLKREERVVLEVSERLRY